MGRSLYRKLLRVACHITPLAGWLAWLAACTEHRRLCDARGWHGSCTMMYMTWRFAASEVGISKGSHEKAPSTDSLSSTSSTLRQGHPFICARRIQQRVGCSPKSNSNNKQTSRAPESSGSRPARAPRPLAVSACDIDTYPRIGHRYRNLLQPEQWWRAQISDKPGASVNRDMVENTNSLRSGRIVPGSLPFPDPDSPGLIRRDLSARTVHPPCCWCGVGPASAVVSTGNDTRQHIKMGHTLSRISHWTCV
jgi:hypothetical protein